MKINATCVRCGKIYVSCSISRNCPYCPRPHFPLFWGKKTVRCRVCGIKMSTKIWNREFMKDCLNPLSKEKQDQLLEESRKMGGV